jgi:hypothetical protein
VERRDRGSIHVETTHHFPENLIRVNPAKLSAIGAFVGIITPHKIAIASLIVPAIDLSNPFHNFQTGLRRMP